MQYSPKKLLSDVMSGGGIEFEFLGFRPEQEFKNIMWTIGEKLHLRSPSDSIMRIAVTQGKRAVKATCRIASEAGEFLAEAVSETPLQAIQLVEEKIKKQLESWRRDRFEP